MKLKHTKIVPFLGHPVDGGRRRKPPIGRPMPFVHY